MKKVLFISIALIALLTSCGGNSNNQTAANSSDTKSETSNLSVYTLENLLADAESLIGKTVKLEGTVTHTCKHAGKRCFVKGETAGLTMRVEAGGKIGGFNRELAGAKLAIEGVVHVRKHTKADLDKYEADLRELQAKGEAGSGHCESEIMSILEMRNWMKDNSKDYYPIYFMNGIDYEILQKATK